MIQVFGEQGFRLLCVIIFSILAQFFCPGVAVPGLSVSHIFPEERVVAGSISSCWFVVQVGLSNAKLSNGFK